MPRYENYPDDIRNYDHDPRSPFYVEPEEEDEDDIDFYDDDDHIDEDYYGP